MADEYYEGWEVEVVLAKWRNKKTNEDEFKVKWLGAAEGEDTSWEPEEWLRKEGYSELIASFEKMEKEKFLFPTADNPAMRDPWTMVYAFLPNPSLLRGSSQFLLECFNHAIYLEVPLPLPYAVTFTSKLEEAQEQLQDEGEYGDGITTSTATGTVIPVVLGNVNKMSSLVGTTAEETSRSNSGSRYHLVLKNLPKVTELEEDYLRGHYTLSAVTLENLVNVTKIGDRCLYNCQLLTSAQLISLPKLKSIGYNFLAQATLLREIVLRDLPELEQIDTSCLSHCSSLSKIILKSLPMLTGVGNRFAAHCPSLKEVVLEDLPAMEGIQSGRLESVSNSFLMKCPALEKLTVRNLPKLAMLPGYAFAIHENLREATFQDLPSLTRVQDRWLFNCPKLRKLTLINIPKLEHTGKMWLEGETPMDAPPKGGHGFVLVIENCHPNVATVLANFANPMKK